MLVRQILTEQVDGKPQVTGVVVEGRTRDSEPDNIMTVRSKAVVSNANVVTTVKKMVGEDKFSKQYLEELDAVRINSSSCQVYMGIREGETIPNIGDLVFTSDAPVFSSEELVDLHTTSRTFSVYYPETRPGTNRYTIVASLNAKMVDWEDLSDEEYEKHKERLIEESLVSLEKYIPDVRSKIDHLEAATPRTINHYTRHPEGTSFGTKFEGLKSSMELPEQITGLYHAGSVGIIMSGWLGSMNYGVITSNKVDKQIVAMKAVERGTPVA